MCSFIFYTRLLSVRTSPVLLQLTIPLGFICATVNTTMVPNYAYIVDITLVSLKMTTMFGFECATLNIAMVPNYANIVNITLVLLSGYYSVWIYMCNL